MIPFPTRRGLLAAGAALAAPTLATPAVGAQTRAPQVTLRVHSFSAPNALDQTMHLNPWAEKVGADSDGRIKVEVYPGLQLGGQSRDLVQQLEDGVVDIIWTAPGFTPGRFMGTEGLELPFMNTGLSATESPAALSFIERHLAATEYRGMKILCVTATDRAVLHTVRKPIRTLEDIRGMRLRVAGRFIGEAVSALGGTPVGIALPGIYEALSRGQVDGMLINWAITAPYRFYEVAKFHTEPAGGLFQGMLLTLMSQRSYERMPAELRGVIDRNSGAALAADRGRAWDTQTQPALDATRAAGNEIIILPDTEKARWRDAVRPAYEAWIGEMNRRGRDGRAMFDDLTRIAQTPRA